jgi:hypothetical protein
MKPIGRKSKKRGQKRTHAGSLISNEVSDEQGEDEDDEDGITGDPSFVFYDFECSQEESLKETAKGTVKRHRVVCAHARLVCSLVSLIFSD